MKKGVLVHSNPIDADIACRMFVDVGRRQQFAVLVGAEQALG